MGMFRIQLHTSRVCIYTLPWHDSEWTTSTIFDTYFISKCDRLSIHSSLPLGPRHHAIPQNQRKQIPCQTEAHCRPRAPLPNLPAETFLLPDGFISPSWAHNSDSFLCQMLVLTIICVKFVILAHI
jgi:hypothetical protein